MTFSNSNVVVAAQLHAVTLHFVDDCQLWLTKRLAFVSQSADIGPGPSHALHIVTRHPVTSRDYIVHNTFRMDHFVTIAT